MSMIKIDNRPSSALTESAVDLSGLSIKEVALSHHKIQLTVFSDQQESISKKINAACGLVLAQFGHKSENDKVKILSTQPNKWLIISADYPTFIESLIDNEQVFISRQSSAYSVIEVTGQQVPALMQQLAFIDWSSASPVVLTQLATDYNGIVECLDTSPNVGYRLYITRSMAKSFWHNCLSLC